MEDPQIADQFHKTLTLESDDDVDTSSTTSDFEFTFSGDRNSPVPAEDIFLNGQIRPIFPFFSEEEATTSYAPKLFVSSPERNDVVEGPYCAWSSEKSVPAPEMRRKSNSTGFSKLRRFRDMLVRSHSDGKDAFVFLNGKAETASEKKKKEKAGKKAESETASEKKKKNKGREKSAYEVFYGNKEKKGAKGRSYLPYKQDLVGFFTSVNGISRNVHPY